MSALIRNILLALGLAGIVWFGYSVFIDTPGSGAPTADTPGQHSVARDASELLIRLNQVKKVNLEGKVMTDARFQSLVDFRQSIVDEPVGRKNPFLPPETEKTPQ